jgi:hypothetical protein
MAFQLAHYRMYGHSGNGNLIFAPISVDVIDQPQRTSLPAPLVSSTVAPKLFDQQLF